MASTDVFSTLQGSVEVGPPHDIKLPIPNPDGETKKTVTDRQLDWMQTEIMQADKHVGAYREAAIQCYRFFSNKQLEDKDMQALKAAQRPANAFNTAQKYIRFVSGVEQKSQELLIFAPEEEYDPQSAMDAENATRAYEWADRTSRGPARRTRSFLDLLITGMAWGDSWVDSTTSLRERIDGDRVSPLETLWPECGADNLRGTRWRAHEIYMDPEDVRRRWPDSDMTISAFSKGGFDPDRPDAPLVQYLIPYVTTEDYSKKGTNERPTKKLKVLEFQWWEEEEGYTFQDFADLQSFQPGDISWMDKARFMKYQQRLRGVFRRGIEGYEEKVQKVYRRAFLLERKHQLGNIGTIPAGRFTLNPMTAYWDEDSKQWYGLMRMLIDPQRYANKFFNQMLEIMATQAKGGLLYEEDTITPKQRRDIEANYAKPGSSQEVARGAISENRILVKKAGDIPAASMQVLDFCVNSMETVTGLSPSGMALDQSAAGLGTVRQRLNSGLILVAKEFSALSEYRIEEGHIMLGLLDVIADGRTVFAGQNPYQPIVFKLDKRIFSRSYIPYLDDTSNDPTIQAKYSEFIMQIAPTLIRTGHFMPSLLDYFRYLPVREREKIKQSMEQEAQQRQEMAKQGIAPGGRGAPKDPKETAAKIQKLESEAALNMARADSLTKGRRPRDFRSIVQALVDAERMMLEKSSHGLDQTKGIVESAGKLVDMFRGVDEGPSGAPDDGQDPDQL
jgi:hypothetical protein